jgi:signal peptidase I
MSKEFWNKVESLIKPVVPTRLEYRLYYNELGEITSGSMVNHSGTGNYIVVTQAEYDRYFDYRIVDCQLKKLDNDAGYRVKLKRNTKGYRVVKGHAGLPLESGETYQETEYYEYRNN